MRTRHGALAASLLVASCLTALAPAARAQSASPTGPDVVVLKDGNVLRGTITDLRPNDHATLTLSNGQTATIRWEVIQDIQKAGASVMNAPAAAAPAPSPAAAASAGGTARVHIESDDPVSVERMDGPKLWSFACTSPCDQDLALDATYRVSGGGVRNSHPFRLAAHPGDKLTLFVDTASKGAFVGGIVLLGIGAPVLVIGGLVLLVNAAVESLDGESSGTDEARTVGWTMVGVGAAGIITGIVLVVKNGSTKVEQGQGLVAREGKLRLDALPNVAVRAPSWRDTLPRTTSPYGAPAATTMIPLLSGHF